MKKIEINEELKKLLKSISLEYFVSNYDKLESKKTSYQDFIDSRFSEKSNNTRYYKSKRIFNQRRNVETLEYISQSKKISEELKNKAQELLDKSKAKSHKEKTIGFSKGELTNFDSFDSLELVQIYSDIIMGLKKRKIIRSMKVTGDIGEYYVENYYKTNFPNLKFELNLDKSSKDIDADDKDEKTYQIKTTTTNDTGDVSRVTNKENILFDYLLVCKLDKYFNLETIYKLTWNDFWEIKIPRKNLGTYKISINANFLSKASIVMTNLE